jgi:hypothetical protein
LTSLKTVLAHQTWEQQKELLLLQLLLGHQN